MASRLAQRGEERVVVLDPVEGRVGEDDVDRLRKPQLDQVLAKDRRALAEALARVRGHRGCNVDAVDASLGDAAHELGRNATRTAARVEHDLVAPECVSVELLERPLELRIGDAVVGGGVPIPGRPQVLIAVGGRHSAVVTGPRRSRSRS